MVDWTEKHRPKRLEDVIGNSEAINKLRSWAESWKAGIPKKHKAVVLIGEPGIGKTTSAHALASEYNWQVVELNASDTRNADAIKAIATMGALGETFTDSGEFHNSEDGMRKMIILDEADNLAGREDRGGVRAISSLLYETKQPIILIVNDYYELKRRSSAVASHAMEIKFRRPQPASIAKLLRKIAQLEGLDVDPEALRAISKRVGGDVRAAINDLQSLAHGRTHVVEKDVIALGNRDDKKTIFQSLAIIFRTMKCQKARQALIELDEDPKFTILWIDENIPISYSLAQDRAAAFDALSKSDIFLGRVYRRQNYRMWAYATDMMSCGVALSKSRDYRGFINYRFPVWLSHMSRSKGIRGSRDSFATKLARLTHTSRSTALQEQLPFFRILYTSDREFCLKMTGSMVLTPEEVAFLLNEKVDSHHVKHVFDDLKKRTAGGTAKAVEKPEQTKEETKDKAKPTEKKEDVVPEKEEETTQKSLLEF